MKKGILCVLVLLAMSICNWNYGQFPIGDKDFSHHDIDVGSGSSGSGSGSSGSSCTKTQTAHPQFGGAIKLKVSATLLSNGTLINNPYLLTSFACQNNGFKSIDYFSTGVAPGSSYNPCGGYTTFNSWQYRVHCFGIIQTHTGGKNLYWNFSNGSCSLC